MTVGALTAQLLSYRCDQAAAAHRIEVPELGGCGRGPRSGGKDS